MLSTQRRPLLRKSNLGHELEAVAMIAGNRFSKLLQSPGRSRMSRDVTVQNPAAADFHDHEDIQLPVACRYRYQEISGYHGLGVIPHEASPVLRGGSSPALRISIVRPVRPHRTGRYQDPQLHRQLRRYTLLAPGRILPHHAPQSIGEDPPESEVVPIATSTASIA
jgi:hypothetical protein